MVREISCAIFSRELHDHMLVYIGYYEVSMTRKSGGKEYSIKMFCVLARNNKAVSSGTGDKA